MKTKVVFSQVSGSFLPKNRKWLQKQKCDNRKRAFWKI